MYPANITRSEAAARAQLIQTTSYRVALDFTGQTGKPEQQFPSKTIIEYVGLTAGQTHLDLIADELLEIRLDGHDLPTEPFTGERYPLTITEGPHTLEVRALCRYSRTGEGVHRFIDPADGRTYLYSQFEVADSRRGFAVFEQPDLKASFEFRITAPNTWQVLSNSPTPHPEPAGDGWATWNFAPTKRISSYITAVCAGDFDVVTDEYVGTKQTIPLSIACRKSLTPHLDAERIFTTTKEGFDVFLHHFQTPYPFDDYAQIFVPEFNFGAMENAGCVTFRDEYIFRSKVTAANYEARDNTILHEMAHMWFGDLVTMRWWDDLWLNESFAEFASHFAQEQIALSGGTQSTPWVTFTNERKTWAYRQDQLPSTHPIAADMVDLEAVELNFDGITYAKGASALRQLVAAVGQDEFLAGVREYFKKHAYGNTELRDLLVELEASCGRDLSYFVTDWLGQSGVNTLRAEFALDSDGCFSEFAVCQEATAAHPTLRKHRMGIGLYSLVDDRLAQVGFGEIDIDGELTPVPELVGIQQPDLILLNAGDLTYAKVRLDDRSLATLLTKISVLDDPLARALCWTAAWDMCRDAELPAEDYLNLVLSGIATEIDLTGVRALLNQGQTAANYFAPRPERVRLLGVWHAGLARLVAQADPGSDHQLAFAQAVIATAPLGTAPLLQDWLAGSSVPEGLTIDADLRWRIVSTLARLGVYTETEIAAELTRDDTLTGREKAMGARAARPDAAAKAAAWAALVESDETPNETHVQGCKAFWQFAQDDLLTPYLERYLTTVSAISAGQDGWDRRSSTIRNNVLELLFPRPLATKEFIERMDAFLIANPVNTAVGRVLAECRDDALRALRCQAANGN